MTYSLQIVPFVSSLYSALTVLSMSNTQEQVPPRPRRQYIEADVSFDHPSESRPSKRLKPSIDLHSAEFYDSLTKVWLTRRALKELDRRTSQVSSPQHPVSSPQCVYPESFVNKIQRFAKHGGPDLCDLRGVRPKCQSKFIISNGIFLVSSANIPQP